MQKKKQGQLSKFDRRQLRRSNHPAARVRGMRDGRPSYAVGLTFDDVSKRQSQKLAARAGHR